MKKISDIILYLSSAGLVAIGILQILDKIAISNNLSGFVALCYGLCLMMNKL